MRSQNQKPAKLPPRVAALAADPAVRETLGQWINSVQDMLPGYYRKADWSALRNELRTVLLLVELFEAADDQPAGKAGAS